MEAFVYCWTDWKENKLYLGSHKGSPDDGYVCSSGRVKKEYKERPDDFTRQIVASGTLDDMRNFEKVLLISGKSAQSEHYYNKNNGVCPPTLYGDDNPMANPEVRKKHKENHPFRDKFGEEAPNYKDGRCSDDPKKYQREYQREYRMTDKSKKYREEINRKAREKRRTRLG